MDKKQAIKSIEHFTEASLSAVYDGNAPATVSYTHLTLPTKLEV